MPKYIKKKALKNAIECCTWYHINPKGELTTGAYGEEDALVKYSDIKKIIKGLPTRKFEDEPQTDVYEYHNGKWTKPQTDCKMPYEDCEDCETHLKAQYAYCNKCKWYGDKQVCGRCRSKNLYAPKDEPQTDCSWK